MNTTDDDRTPAAVGDRPLVLADEHAREWSPGTGRARFREGLAGPAAAVAASRPPFAITRAPEQVFLTDVRDAQYRAA